MKYLKRVFVFGLALWMAGFSAVNYGAAIQPHHAKKKHKKKKTVVVEDHEDSKYFSKASDTGGPYRFNAEGEPIYSQQKPKKPKHKAIRKKKHRPAHRSKKKVKIAQPPENSEHRDNPPASAAGSQNPAPKDSNPSMPGLNTTAPVTPP